MCPRLQHNVHSPPTRILLICVFQRPNPNGVQRPNPMCVAEASQLKLDVSELKQQQAAAQQELAQSHQTAHQVKFHKLHQAVCRGYCKCVEMCILPLCCCVINCDAVIRAVGSGNGDMQPGRGGCNVVSRETQAQ